MSTPRLIFEKTDSLTDPDLYVEEHRGAGGLSFGVNNGEVQACVTLDRDEILPLYAALGEWLYPVHTPEAPNRSLIEQMIEKAVRDQVAAVLPLHLSPVACTHGGFCRDASDVQVIECPEPQDPEPRDVGHPEPEPQHGRLMSELPRRAPRCLNCTHSWAEHTGGICWGEDGGNACTCTRERPGTTHAPCTCDMHHSHRPVVRNGSPATCAYRDCECQYRGAP